jgi:hypothetical protein
MSSKNGSGTTFPIMKQTQAINQQNATDMCFMNVQKKEKVILRILAQESLDLEL